MTGKLTPIAHYLPNIAVWRGEGKTEHQRKVAKRRVTAMTLNLTALGLSDTIKPE